MRNKQTRSFLSASIHTSHIHLFAPPRGCKRTQVQIAALCLGVAAAVVTQSHRASWDSTIITCWEQPSCRRRTAGFPTAAGQSPADLPWGQRVPFPFDLLGHICSFIPQLRTQRVCVRSAGASLPLCYCTHRLLIFITHRHLHNSSINIFMCCIRLPLPPATAGLRC